MAAPTLSGVSPPARMTPLGRGDLGGASPVDGPPGAAVPHWIMHVEQQGRAGRRAEPARSRRARRHPEHGHTESDERRHVVDVVDLHRAEPGRADGVPNVGLGRSDEYPHA